ncbi:DinB family protein [Paenibacillus polysaccharolyticus]|uniref:DinB family protein n=1 Tax=Paenibacillus polysaccharolyticus TaxID=582692 RepID=UPI00203FBBD2|nr:DinB family protein [Paenibacillus polysaccharolyticus]MCM3132877.1 DinB family protein [Paenibacillus polysaccharolyticus]
MNTNFRLHEAIEILERTPQTLGHFLSGLSDGWLHSNEGEGTWNAHEVMEHLIEAEKHNWIPRVQSIVVEGEPQRFPTFDRFSHLKETSERTTEEALQEFSMIRKKSISSLKDIILSNPDLEKTGLHPEFGLVKLRELLSAWVVHDFTHIAQIVRVMAERYRMDVGPWSAYLGILNKS